MKFRIKGIYRTGEVWLNGKPLNPTKSQLVRNHSPDGFAWGYGGSGPAQLALAICIELFGQYRATQFYQDFKFKHIGGLPQSNIDGEIYVDSMFVNWKNKCVCGQNAELDEDHCSDCLESINMLRR